jgi:hypothetical protein
MKKLSYLLILVLLSFTSWCQSIPRSTPEAEGVSSAAIQKFIESYKKEKSDVDKMFLKYPYDVDGSRVFYYIDRYLENITFLKENINKIILNKELEQNKQEE